LAWLGTQLGLMRGESFQQGFGIGTIRNSAFVCKSRWSK
jgi:hypothetical protein